MTVLLTISIISALINRAGVINVVLNFLMLGEPFIFLIAITSTKLPESSIKRFQNWVFRFVYIHLIFVYFQKFIINTGDPDDVKGIFLNMGAGHHVGGDVALTFGIYFLLASGVRSLWFRILMFVLCLGNVLFADVKQVIFAFIVSWFILILTQLKEVWKALLYLLIALPVTFIVLQIINSLYSGIRYISDMAVVTDASRYKLSVFSIIISFFKSDLNWLFGLGPGHTTSRLGWLIPDYLNLLQPLGVTYTDVFPKVFLAQESYYWSNSYTGSSMYSLLFSWAGIWGDLGFLGLGIYLFLWFLVWKYICVDKTSKFFLITIMVSGVIFSWMEEPAFMIFVTSLIGLQWQKYQAHQTKKLQQQRQDYFFEQKSFLEKPYF
ncbi:hypothetical protein [Scytonema sp. NUACC21]